MIRGTLYSGPTQEVENMFYFHTQGLDYKQKALSNLVLMHYSLQAGARQLS